MKPSELRTKSDDELRTMLTDKQAEYAGQRQSLRAGELSNVRVITSSRREIARLKTVINEKRNTDAAKEEK